jgi:hypothetical protein
MRTELLEKGSKDLLILSGKIRTAMIVCFKTKIKTQTHAVLVSSGKEDF